PDGYVARTPPPSDPYALPLHDALPIYQRHRHHRRQHQRRLQRPPHPLSVADQYRHRFHRHRRRHQLKLPDQRRHGGRPAAPGGDRHRDLRHFRHHRHLHHHPGGHGESSRPHAYPP